MCRKIDETRSQKIEIKVGGWGQVDLEKGAKTGPHDSVETEVKASSKTFSLQALSGEK